MPGNGNACEQIFADMLKFAHKIMITHRVFPWVAYVVKDSTVISRGYNSSRETKDPTMFSGVTAIRLAQNALDPGDLTGCTLYGIFQPVLLDFDVALWAGIRDFAWSISQKDAPEHYSDIPYSLHDYVEHHPGEISLTADIFKTEALALVEEAKQQKYWNYSLYNSR